MFITVDGLNKTGIPSALWDIMEPYSRVDRASGVAILAVVILVLSNLASNVPTGKWPWINFTDKIFTVFCLGEEVLQCHVDLLTLIVKSSFSMFPELKLKKFLIAHCKGIKAVHEIQQ